MIVTTKRKKIEILLDAPLLKRIRIIAEEASVSAFTLLPVIGGYGGQGRWQDDQVTGGAGSKLMLVTIADQDTANSFLGALSPILDEYGLVVTVSEVEVIRAERF